MVNKFQVELTEKVGSLCNTVSTSLSQQNEHLQCVEDLCHSFLGIHDEVYKITLLPAFFLFVSSFHVFPEFVIPLPIYLRFV